LTGPDNILPASTGLYLATNTVLNLNGINQAVARLTGFGTVNLGSGSFAVTDSATNTFGGSFTGNPNGVTANDTQPAPPGGFALAGTGKLTLTNVQAYVGDTWVSSGTLALSGVGSLASSSNLVVASGATLDASARTDGTLKLISGQTLGGFGSVVGKVVATNGAAIAPGNSVNIGTLTFNSTVNLTGGQAQMTISKSGATLGNDLLTGITTLTCGGSLIVTNFGPDALAAGDSFKLFNATTFAGVFTNFNLPPLATNLMWNTSQIAANGTLSVIAIVPPVLSGAALFGGGGFQLTFSGPAGQTYKILTSTNLVLPMVNWTFVTNGTFSASPVTFTNGIAPGTPAGYFRIASP
jgi:hypothetical protein